MFSLGQPNSHQMAYAANKPNALQKPIEKNKMKSFYFATERRVLSTCRLWC